MTIKKAITAPVAGLALAAVAILGTGSSDAGVTYTNQGYAHTTTGGSNLPMLAAGVQELGLEGHLNLRGSTDYALRLSYGRFFTENWLLGVRTQLADTAGSGFNIDLGVFAEYNFLTGTQWVPFVGVHAAWDRANRSGIRADAIQLGLDLGVKYFFRPNIAISGSTGVEWVSDRLPGDDDVSGRIDLGLRFFF